MHILQTQNSDSVKARTNFLLADYWQSIDTLRSRENLKNGKVLAKNNAFVNALYYYYEGQYYFNRNNVLSAKFYKRAEQLLSRFNTREAYCFRAAAWYNYGITKRIDKGEIFFINIILDKCIPLSEKAMNQEKIAQYYCQVGASLMYNTQFDKADIYLHKAIDILESKYPHSPVLLSAYLSTTINYCHKGNSSAAKKNLDKARKILRSAPKSTFYPNFPYFYTEATYYTDDGQFPYYYYCETMYYTTIGRYNSALISLKKGIPLAKRNRQTILSKLLIAKKYEVFSKLKQYKQAKELLLTLLHDGPLDMVVNNKKTIYEQLAKTNAELGLMEEAYKWSIAYNKLNDSLYENKLKEHINALEIKFRSIDNQKKIADLNAINQKTKLVAKNNRLINWFLGLISFFLFVVAAFTLLYLRKSKKLHIQKELNHEQKLRDIDQREQLKIVEAMLKGQEEERTRLAADLHDGLGGLLASLKINLSNYAFNNSELQSSKLTGVISLLDHSISELRHIAHNMMPETMLKLGIEDSLAELCRSMASANLPIVFQCLGLKNNILSQEQIIIYRIVQELLANVVQHANAKNVLLQCSQNENFFFITLEDDGDGFDIDLQTEKKGMGLKNIKRRVDYLNGKIEIFSQPNRQGTTFNIELNVTI